MKPISEVVISALDAKRESNQQATLDPLCVRLVDKIFVKIALLCRGFDSFYADRNRLNAEKTQWILAFTKLGIRNQSQIQQALNALEFYKYPNPPQLGEFLEWRHSKPESMGFPTVDEAFQLSIQLNRQFSDYKCEDPRVESVIRHAIRQIDSLTYRSMPIHKARPTFEHYYTVALRQFMEGKLEEINSSIEDKSSESQEIKKQESIIKPEYKSVNSHSAAMNALSKILGKEFKGEKNSKGVQNDIV